MLALPYFFIGALCFHLFILNGKYPEKYITNRNLCLAGIVTYVIMFNKPFTLGNMIFTGLIWLGFAALVEIVESLYNWNKCFNNSLEKAPSILTIMENAASNSAKIINDRFNLKNKNVTIFSGTETNGGIGLILARYAKKYGANVNVLIPKKSEDISFYYTKTNCDVTRDHGIQIFVKNLPERLKIDLAIDAMVGTDLYEYYEEYHEKIRKKYKGKVSFICLGKHRHPKVPGFYRDLIELFNRQKCTKISIDSPTGIDPKTGKSSPMKVKPDITISFNAKREGLNKSNAGEIIVTDIGIKK